MRTIDQAIREQTQRYIEAASDAAADPDSRVFRNRLRYRCQALKRLRQARVRLMEPAVREETRRYVESCLMVLINRGADDAHWERVWAHRAHIHALAIARLRGVPSWDAKECFKAGA